MTEDTSFAIKAGRPKADLEDARLATSIGARLFGRSTTTEVGRFRLDGRLGAGGMGVVYEAFDPKLQRPVALKLLAGAASGDGRADAVLAEARAAAKIRHPHVVEIFDTGQDDRHVWIAMELCPGVNLRAWCEARTWHWRAVVELFIQCAEALAEGHRLGVVHRDFKPHNVIVETLPGGVHRAKVVDFGLAAVGEAGEDGDLVVGGTPGYMAPEQRAGEVVDGRADQYSFCVALYEALHGRRPSETADEATTATAGRMPRWLQQTIERGLLEQPEQRYADMDEVVERLRRGLGRRAKVIGSLFVATSAAAALGGVVAMTQGPPDPCNDASAPAAVVWSEQRRAEVSEWFARSAPESPDAAIEFSSAMDGWIGEWNEHNDALCRRTHAREVGAAVDDLSAACLGRRLATVDGLVEAAVESPPSLIGAAQAVAASQQLPGLEVCDNATFLLREVTPEGSPQQLEAVGALDKDIAALGGQLRFAFYGDAIGEIEARVEQARALGHPPLLARALRLQGHALSELGRLEDAQRVTEDSYLAAIEGRTDIVASEAALLLGWVHARYRGDLDAATRWLDQARAWIEPLDDPPSWAEWYHYSGIVAAQRGDLEQAQRWHEAALAIRTDHVRLQGSRWASLNELSIVAKKRGDTQASLEYAEAALQSVKEAMRPEHPYFASVLSNLGAAAQRAGDLDRARESVQEALRLKRLALGEGHVELATTLTHLGNIEAALGRVDDALRRYKAAIDVTERTLGPNNVRLAAPMFNYAIGLADEQRYSEALRYYGRAGGLYRAEYGDAHPYSIGAGVGQSQCYVGLGRYDEAHALLEATYEHAKGVDMSPVDRAELLFELARARYRQPRSRGAAVPLGEQALQLCESRRGAVCDAVRAWPPLAGRSTASTAASQNAPPDDAHSPAD